MHHLVTHEIGSTIRPARQRLTHRRFLLSFMLSLLFYASATDWDDKKTPSCVCRPKSETSVHVVRCFSALVHERSVLNLHIQSQTWKQEEKAHF